MGGGKADLRPICSTSSIHHQFIKILSISLGNFYCVGGAREVEELTERRGGVLGSSIGKGKCAFLLHAPSIGFTSLGQVGLEMGCHIAWLEFT
jgi:hypothetical protein